MVAFAGPAYPLDNAAQVLAGMREFAADAPDEINLSATFWTIPAVDAFPQHFHGRPVVIVGGVYIGPTDEGERILHPLREFGEPLLDLSGVLPYTALQQMFDPFFPAHQRLHYWKSLYLDDLGDEASAAQWDSAWMRWDAWTSWSAQGPVLERRQMRCRPVMMMLPARGASSAGPSRWRYEPMRLRSASKMR